ncbi:MAG: DNA methyltransferase [Thermoanaerobacteraceae bacterium]|nr:DNA methyltransferase [Thermoanaerobacteraceae bacterium]
MNPIKVSEFPDFPSQNQIYEIVPNKSVIVGSTHRLFNKYPTRYIPQVPRWAILKYSSPGDIVLDPFCGSGTTLVEALLNRRNGLAIDIDPFARLLTSVKTTRYSAADIERIDQIVNKIMNNLTISASADAYPDIPNISKWFNEQAIERLAVLKTLIDEYAVDRIAIKNYLYIVLAAIVRRCSNAENESPKPYISTRFPKVPDDPFIVFFETESLYRSAIIEFAQDTEGFEVSNTILSSNDARNIVLDSMVELAVTSPPYINAYDYVRILKFENMWLGLADNSELVSLRKEYIGTEISSSFYTRYQYAMQSETLCSIMPAIENVDIRRASMVGTYFEDMALNLIQVRDVLVPGGRYVIVVGDSTIRNQNVPTTKILTEIALANGYVFETVFKYVIRDRYLHMPRGNRGGIIKYDNILVLQKRKNR